MAPFEIFHSSQVTTECEECAGRADVVTGGACPRCRRILCAKHLHGSFVQRLIADVGGSVLCVRCRRDGR